MQLKRRERKIGTVKSLLLVALLASSLAFPALAAQVVPKPTLRPSPGAATEIPVPRLRPVPPPAPETPEPETAKGWPAEQVAAGKQACAAELKGLDIAYEPLDPIGRAGGCGAPAPILVRAVSGVTLTPPATLTCAMAEALHEWVTRDVQPAAAKRLGTKVTEIRTATSYACRYRNNGSSGKMSEHSKANALDMSGFSFAKTGNVAVDGQGQWGEKLIGPVRLSKGGSFLGEIRLAACSRFTTVLGPGSDPYHGDHFHVDVLQRKGGYRICQ